MTTNALQTVEQFQQSLASGTELWKNLLAEDISFIGPVEQVSGKAANIELNKNFFPLVRGYVPVSAFQQGKYALLEGKIDVATPKGNIITLDLAEVYEVKNNLIQKIRIYYDAEEFRKEFTPVV